MGIQLTGSVAHYLQVKEQQRSRRLQEQKKAEKKKARNKRKFDRLQQATLIAKKERLSRAGKYRRGMNLDITAAEEADLPVVRTVKKEVPTCPHPFCCMKGHKTTRSKACKANPERLHLEGTTVACAAALEAATSEIKNEQETSLEALDLNQHEAVPFLDADDSSMEMYKEAQTWSEDEDGNIIDHNTAII